MKLTKPQRKLLTRLLQGPANRNSSGYNAQTASFLVRNGLARPLGYSGFTYSSIEITRKGQKAISDEDLEYRLNEKVL